MKKLLSIILLLSMSVTFYSCGDDMEEEFVWNGDWNDPADPNYKPEGYNPIQGLWRRDTDDTRGLYYSEDFKIYKVYFHPNGYVEKSLWADKYIINDKAYNISSKGTWRYKIEIGKFWDTPDLNDDSDWRSYTRVEE
ncbi:MULTISPECIES: hypothetical protein [Dysgonomonas]|uniref:hypothetical protein n=1 Tax=Dysgonomonas TaxID=156973 RepID=UPI00092BFC93|nr:MULTISPECIES: hypothetical protein [Dysgonomonas]MBN9300307.1 hypothetical protein [Dysgonomonas mossii]OJX60484.1 MAG: hypothetical protein BGO84_08900 [Dysgonomonas sp. 37-18]